MKKNLWLILFLATVAVGIVYWRSGGSKEESKAEKPPTAESPFPTDGQDGLPPAGGPPTQLAPPGARPPSVDALPVKPREEGNKSPQISDTAPPPYDPPPYDPPPYEPPPYEPPAYDQVPPPPPPPPMQKFGDEFDGDPINMPPPQPSPYNNETFPEDET